MKFQAARSMIRNMTILSVCALFAVLHLSCGGGAGGRINTPGAAQQMSFVTLKTGDTSEFDNHEFMVVADEEALRDIWDKTTATPAPEPGSGYSTEMPDIDFQNNTVIAVFAGARGSGGYSIRVTDITETDDAVVVEVCESTPQPGTIVTLSFTQPFHIVQMEKTSKPVPFKSST